jgi:predicted transcriptional regulator of viral defense system
MSAVTRSVPPSLAPVLEWLELERPEIVTTEQIREFCERRGVASPVSTVISKLAHRGWLLKTDTHGVWEFAPAERAGAYSSRDTLLALKGVLATAPETRFSVCLTSALWLHDLMDRRPSRIEVALPPREYVPRAIRRSSRVLRFEPHLEPVEIRGVPAHRLETVLVHLAARPTDVQNWGSVLEVLAELVESIARAALGEELAGRSHATRARLAYLVSGVAPDLASALNIASAGKVWFGPRTKTRRHNARWNIADTILPIAPAELGGR